MLGSVCSLRDQCFTAKVAGTNAAYEIRVDPVWEDAVEANEVIGIGSDQLSNAALVTIACKYLLIDENSDGCKRPITQRGKLLRMRTLCWYLSASCRVIPKLFETKKETSKRLFL